MRVIRSKIMASPSEIPNARALLGMTQAELADAIGVTQQAVALWEQHGTKNIKLKEAVKLGYVLKVDIHRLFPDAMEAALKDMRKGTVSHD